MSDDTPSPPNEFLLTLGRGADDDQQALRGVFEPGLHMDAVDPEVDGDAARTLRIGFGGARQLSGFFQPLLQGFHRLFEVLDAEL